MNAAIIQIGSGNNKTKNIERALYFVRRAIRHKATFILLPEAFNFRGKIDSQKAVFDVAERIPGPSIKPFMETARKHKVFILAGSICEKVRGERKVFNTSVLIGPRGKIMAKYQKIHLFDAQIGKVKIKESRFFAAGRRPATAKVGSLNIGMSICYDLRFSELYQKYKKGKVDVLCVPSAFTRKTGEAHWEMLLRARAIESICYVLAPNQIGKDGEGVASYGNSMAIDPWGKVLARASGTREEIVMAELKKTVIKEKRKILGIN